MLKEEFKALSVMDKIKVLSSSFDATDVNDMSNKLSLISVIVIAENGGDAEKAFLEETINNCFDK